MSIVEDIEEGEARRLATGACRALGASAAMATSLADAVLSAAGAGVEALGFPHLMDYLDALAAGRIVGSAEPALRDVAPAFIAADARGGIAQLGFDRAFDDLAGRARRLGIALFTQANAFTAGELGYYVRRLAGAGLVAQACANGPALMAARPGTGRVYCTNPLAFAVPLGPGEPPLVVDQATSATAFVKVLRAAREGGELPEGWAVDAAGRPTRDAAEAAQGALLPFGGDKGANLALMVEMLAAGLSGALWSLDSPDFRAGADSPGCGLTVIAIAPAPDFAARGAAQARRLAARGVHIPGQRPPRPLRIAAADLARLKALADA